MQREKLAERGRGTGRSPTAAGGESRRSLLCSGGAGTGCAPVPAFPLHFPVPLLLRLPALPLFCRLPHPGTGRSPAARRAALRTKSAAARGARRGCALPYPHPLFPYFSSEFYNLYIKSAKKSPTGITLDEPMGAFYLILTC